MKLEDCKGCSFLLKSPSGHHICHLLKGFPIIQSIDVCPLVKYEGKIGDD